MGIGTPEKSRLALQKRRIVNRISDQKVALELEGGKVDLSEKGDPRGGVETSLQQGSPCQYTPMESKTPPIASKQAPVAW